MNRSKRIVLIAIGSAIPIVILAIVLTLHQPRAESSVAAAASTANPVMLSDRTAASLAVQYVQRGMPGSSNIGAPTAINGQMMPYASAIQLNTGRPPYPGNLTPEAANQPVWFIILRMDMQITNAPATIGGFVPITRSYHQVSVIMDAATGVLMEVTALPASKEVSVATLQSLSVPTGSPVAFPSVAAPSAPGHTVTPAPKK